MNTPWQSTPKSVWQGRDDLIESPIAKRVFQVIKQNNLFNPQAYNHKIALLGFMCDEGIELNKGRTGAKEAPNALRKILANLAAHHVADQLVDLGNIQYLGGALEDSQKIFAQHITQCQQNNLVTLVFGGGHETAYAHGQGIYDAYPDKTIGIINFDAHLDVRTAQHSTSGTPFKQLASYCSSNNRPFHYLCVGASLSANTEALITTAHDLNVNIIWDTDCCLSNLIELKTRVQNFISQVDIVYLTIDLDVLPSSEMFAVSAPSALGVETRLLMLLAKEIAHSDKLKAVDLVEYNPSFDTDHRCARVAARIAWQICHDWYKHY